MKHLLNGTWQLQFKNPMTKELVLSDVTVPSNIETELKRLGLIDDYMPADNIQATTAFDLTSYRYYRTFDAPELPKDCTRELVFEGIDTVAEVYLNGEKLFDSINMHRSYRIPIGRNTLMKTGNILEVRIGSVELYARHKESEVFAMQRPGCLYEGNQYVRKARYAWGWDHAPRVLTTGIFRDVYLEDLPKERFLEPYLFTAKITDTEAHLGFRWEYVLPDTVVMKDYTVRYTLFYKGEPAYVGEEQAFFPRGVRHIKVPLDRIGLWWPKGYGAPALCEFRLEMLKDGECIAERTDKWGIRTVRFLEKGDLASDEKGDLRFIVNNVDVFLRGTNWKPLDPLPSLAGEKLPKALALLSDLECNAVRIWGGGYYEDHPFFDFCDENGILVWQDFMLACEVPSRDDAYCEEVRKEAREIIKRLRNHPSLAIWCGDNENDQNFSWAHKDGTALPSDQRISREILRSAVIENDPFRAYVASSPRVSDRAFLEYRETGTLPHGLERHLYHPDSFTDGYHLRTLKSRFLGEVGPWGASAASIHEDIFMRERARAERLWDKERDPSVPLIDAHQHDTYFMQWRQSGRKAVLEWFGRDFSVAEWKDFCLALNVACAEVFKDTVEYFRISRPEKTGVLWWSLLDMWPMLYNYSVVDSSFRPKLPYHFLKRSQQSFALIVSRKEYGGKIALYAANETLDVHEGHYTVRAISECGEERTVLTGSYRVPKNRSAAIALPIETDARELWLIEWEGTDGLCGRNHFLAGKRPYDLEKFKKWLERLSDFYGAELLP